MPRKAAAAPPGIQALNLGKMPGALQIPNVRRPTRGSMGGTAPRGARTRMQAALAAGGSRGGGAVTKAKTTARKTTTRKKKVA